MYYKGYKPLIDTHTHTVLSTHAFSSLEENTKEAEKKGIKLMAFTDHGCLMPGAPDRFMFNNMKILPRVINNTIVLKGVEANIINQEGVNDMEDPKGKLNPSTMNFDPHVLSNYFELVICSLHDTILKPMDKSTATKTLINTIKRNRVDILGHLGSPLFQFHHEEVLKVAKDYDILIEFNNSSFTHSRAGSPPICRKIAEMAAKLDMNVVLSSDAHYSSYVGSLEEAQKCTLDSGIKPERILNFDLKLFLNFLIEKRGKTQLKEVLKLI